jgi:hypothetical protein
MLSAKPSHKAVLSPWRSSILKGVVVRGGDAKNTNILPRFFHKLSFTPSQTIRRNHVDERYELHNRRHDRIWRRELVAYFQLRNKYSHICKPSCTSILSRRQIPQWRRPADTRDGSSSETPDIKFYLLLSSPRRCWKERKICLAVQIPPRNLGLRDPGLRPDLGEGLEVSIVIFLAASFEMALLVFLWVCLIIIGISST